MNKMHMSYKQAMTFDLVKAITFRLIWAEQEGNEILVGFENMDFIQNFDSNEENWAIV